MAIKKYHVSKNLFDLASWITANGSTYTKDGESYTFNTQQSMYSTPFYFSEEDITVSISGIIKSITAPSPRLHLLHADGTSAKSGALTPSTTKSENVSCAGLRFDWSSTGGTVKITNLMLNTGQTALPYEPYGNTWNSIPYRKYGTETDTLTSLPADVIADGQSATANIIGNMVQTGTPSPQSIIMPSETGDKTANLWSGGNVSIAVGDRYKNTSIDLPTNTYTFKAKYSSTNTGSVTIGFYDENNTIHTYNMTQINGEVSASYTGIITAIRLYSAAGYTPSTSYSADFADIMLNSGSTLLPYEPYGYKIPILSGGTTTNVYLGEVQSERKIKQLVLTGQEAGWTGAEASGNRNRFVLNVSDAITADTSNPYSICSHLPLGASGATYSRDNVYTIASGKLYMRLTIDYDSLTTFKTYLQQQYANGTPVCVWYVLATETTGVVNEPLRKIGDYSDSVSVTGIPTTSGSQQFDVDTTLKPSEVQLTYHGWHEHSDTKFT